jgi:hypothetical protein
MTDHLRALVVFFAVFVLAAQSGGFLADAWGWAALPLLLLVACVLAVADRVVLGRSQLALLLLLGALVVWTALSAAWSTAGPAITEAERTVVYVSALAAVFVTGARTAAVATGVLGASTAISAWSLWGRLFPEHALTGGGPDTGRLAGPIGYANGLGLVAAIGVLLAIGLAAERRVWTAPALVVLLPTLVFTFSRGSWLALALGLVVLLALESLRGGNLLHIAAALPLPVIAAALADRSHALTHVGSPLARAEHDGHRLAAELVVLLLLVPLPVLAARRSRQGVLRPRLGRAVALVSVAILAAGIAAALLHAGRSGATSSTASLNSRLFSSSGNGRGDYWSVAWREVRAHPLLGGGAGSWSRWWLAYRPSNVGALDAHNLYLETLAELGPVGLLLLLGALATPLLALARGVRSPVGAACAAAYAAFLVHAALDWDWELPSVALCGLLCGAALLVSNERNVVAGRARAAALALTIGVAACVFVLQVGNASSASSEGALNRGDLHKAIAAARRAERWQPWSAQPSLLLGEAKLAAGDVAGAARAFRAGIRLDEGDSELWYQLALATTGPERARARARALALDPTGPAHLLRK